MACVATTLPGDKLPLVCHVLLTLGKIMLGSGRLVLFFRGWLGCSSKVSLFCCGKVGWTYYVVVFLLVEGSGPLLYKLG